MDQNVALRIIISDAPPGVDFGLQKGKGSNYETVQVQRSGKGDLKFECSINLRKNAKSIPDFFGPFVHGPSSERFVYIDIGACAGQKRTKINRRLKIPLYTIDKETINHLFSYEGSILETTIEGTGGDGGPTCGTVKPFKGWSLWK